MASSNNLQPPRFTGSDGIDINLWLRLFEDFAKDSGWDDKKQASKIKLLLSGEAQVFVWDLDDSKQDSYEKIKKELVEFYSSKENCFSAMVEFEDRKRVKGESWRQLCYALKLLYMKARPDHDQSVRDNAVKHRLLRLVDVGSRETILKAENVNDLSPEILADRIGRVERITADNSGAVVASSKPDPVEQRLNKMQQELEEIVARIDGSFLRNGNHRGRTKGRCYFCGGTGHYASRCPRKRTSKPTESTMICFRCSGKGHRASVCPSSRSENL